MEQMKRLTRRGLDGEATLNCTHCQRDGKCKSVRDCVDVLTDRLVTLEEEQPYAVGTTVYHLPKDGVLKDHIIELVVNGYSKSDWQGTKNKGKDNRFIIFHGSYNEPHAYQLKECYATRAEAVAAMEGRDHAN